MTVRGRVSDDSPIPKSAPEFGVTTTRDGAHAEIAVHGELDLHTAPRVKDEVDTLIGAGVTEIDFDCSDLTFVDSTGLGTLIAALKRAREAGGDVRITQTSRVLRKLLDITRLGPTFGVD